MTLDALKDIRIRSSEGKLVISAKLKSVLATSVDHQGAYDVSSLKDIKDRPALQFTLRAIVKMVQEIPIS